MAITPKQERNGHAPEPEGTFTPPGPMPALPIAEAEAAAQRWMDVAVPIWNGENPGGAASSWDWSNGLAIVESGAATIEGSPTTSVPPGDVD